MTCVVDHCPTEALEVPLDAYKTIYSTYKHILYIYTIHFLCEGLKQGKIVAEDTKNTLTFLELFFQFHVIWC